MSNDKTKAVKPADKTTNKNRAESAKKVLIPVIDWLAKMAGAAFFIATSYGYVQQWLKVHQTNEQIPVAGGIAVVAIALYLYTRKR